MKSTFQHVFRTALVLFLFLFGVGIVYLFSKERLHLNQEDYIISALLAGISGLVAVILIIILRLMKSSDGSRKSDGGGPRFGFSILSEAEGSAQTEKVEKPNQLRLTDDVLPI